MSDARSSVLITRSGADRGVDTVVARHLLALANRQSRRSFLGWIGRASIAMLGAGYIDVWNAESAQAACVWEGPFRELGRATCLCTELIGSNNCPNCCSGFWESCPLCTDEDACCSGGQQHKVRLFDCCGPCNGGCVTNSSCGSTRNQSCCSTGYCADGGCGTKHVRCVRKVCTTVVC